MQVKILGVPELHGVEGPVVVAPQLWCVLLSLVLSPGVPVSAEVLIDRLWGDDPPVKARATVRTYIRRIERKLSQAAGSEICISRHGHGYALDINPQDVDLHRFRGLWRQSESQAEGGGPVRAAALLRRAEAQWQGETLAGLSGEWVSGIRVRLDEELRSVIGSRVELELMLGRHAALLGELAELSERYPLDETFTALRMIAMFRAGRNTDALRVYRDTRTRLISDGLEPGPRLADLYVRIVRNDPELQLTQRPRAQGRDDLPADPTDFVGREHETRLLSDGGGRVLAVVEGMGGAGKTTLAVRVARLVADRYPDGQFFLSLRAHDPELGPVHPADALRDLLTKLGVSETGETLAERAVHWRDELADRRIVVILDDAEGPDQVRALIPDEAECMVIVTSRVRARWDADRTVVLGALPDNDASALFTRIAGPAVPADAELVARAIDLCGRLPLAIKLAAIQLKEGGGVDDLLRDLAVGTGGVEGVADQLRSAFELSYLRLSPDLRRLFRFLGASPCQQITTQVAATLTGLSLVEAEMSLRTLADHYLIDEQPDGGFDFHDLVRSYAFSRSRLEDSESETGAAVRCLADHYLREAGRASRVVQADRYTGGLGSQAKPHEFYPRPELSDAREWLVSEWRNVLRIAEYCDKHEQKRRCISLIHSISDFLETNGHWDQSRDAALTALRASRDIGDVYAAANSAFALSLVCLKTGRTQEALSFVIEAEHAYREAGDKGGRAGAIDRKGLVSRYRARFREALAHHQEAADMYRASGDQIGMATAMLHAATALDMLGRYAEEMAWLSEALGVYRQQGHLSGQACVLNNLGAVLHYRGYHRHAMSRYQEAYAIFREIGGRQNLALLDQNIGEIYQYKGRLSEALALYGKALSEFRAMGDLRCQAMVLIDMGSARQADSDYAQSMAHYERAVAIAETVDDPYAHAFGLFGIADVRREQGDLDDAIRDYEHAAGIASAIESHYLMAKILNGMAEAMLPTRGVEAARIYWREACDIFEQIGAYEAAAVRVRLQVITLRLYCRQ
jgi:DNA-binding SARP family transcriptional activator/tetratricopeptide (TPR) repeat protein